MTISPATIIIAIIFVVVVVALLCNNGRLTKKLAKYESDADSMIKKIDGEMKPAPSAEALAKRQWRAGRVVITTPNGTKRYVPEYMCDRVPSEKQFGRHKWVLKPKYINKLPKAATEEVEINPRTGKPYKTPKRQREASKRWNNKHPERNSTENAKASQRTYSARYYAEHKDEYVSLYFDGLPHTAKKEHCHRVMGSHGREKWEVLPQFRDVYPWCRGAQDEKKNA